MGKIKWKSIPILAGLVLLALGLWWLRHQYLRHPISTWPTDANWYLVIVGFFTAAIMAWQSVETRRSASAAKKSVEALLTLERGFLTVRVRFDVDKFGDKKPHVMEGDGSDGPTTCAYLVVKCRNDGRSVMQIDTVNTRLYICPRLQPIPDYLGLEVIRHGPLTLAKGKSVCTSWTAITKGHVDNHQKLFVYGYIAYRDIFETKRLTAFGYEIVDRKFKRLSEVLYPFYNRHS
jgi:hypothetical protein